MIEMLFENGSTYMMSTMEYRFLIVLACLGAIALWGVCLTFIFNMYSKFKRRFKLIVKRERRNLNID